MHFLTECWPSVTKMHFQHAGGMKVRFVPSFYNNGNDTVIM